MKKLIVNIRHETEKDNYTIRDEAGQRLVGLATIEQVDTWLKSCKGGFTPDVGPIETEAGWIREASIPMWYYLQLMGLISQLEKAA